MKSIRLLFALAVAIGSKRGVAQTPASVGSAEPVAHDREQPGRFEIMGFAGSSGPDHIDHFHGIPKFLRRVEQP